MESDSLLPQLHPRYSEEETQPVVEAPKKIEKVEVTPPEETNSSQERTPESRALYIKFCESFEEVHGYKYAGNYWRDSGNFQKFLKEKGIDFETVSSMIDYIFQEKRGYWKSDIATVVTICYNQSSHTILNEVRKRKKMEDDPTWKSKLGKL